MSDNNLNRLQPEAVFRYFREIAQIPRPSYHEKLISDYLVQFAQNHHLEYVQDALYNVIIIKDAAPGYEDAAPVILQGHMDMVCEKKPGCEKDLFTEGLTLRVDGDYLSAEGTTLGGDDGIALAYALAILESDTLKHPRIAFICTVSEETGMEGAAGLDVSMLQGRRMINLDSEKEGELLCGCAGGGHVTVRLPLEMQQAAVSGVTQKKNLPDHAEQAASCAGGWKRVSLRVTGLLSGHSGTEIDKGRANAIILLAEILQELFRQYDTGNIYLISAAGGTKDNVIPQEAEAVIIVREAETSEKILQKISEKIRKEYHETDPDITVAASVSDLQESGPDFSEDASADPCNEGALKVISNHTVKKLLALICNIPNGVQEMHKEIPGLVGTSLNLGVLRCERSSSEFVLQYLLRSAYSRAFEELSEKVCNMAEAYGAAGERGGEYPAWEFLPQSELRGIMCRIYTEQYGEEPEVSVIHAGVECGLFAEKLPGLDAVSIGPDILDIHTPAERLSISSAARVYEYLLRVLEELK